MQPVRQLPGSFDVGIPTGAKQHDGFFDRRGDPVHYVGWGRGDRAQDPCQLMVKLSLELGPEQSRLCDSLGSKSANLGARLKGCFIESLVRIPRPLILVRVRLCDAGVDTAQNLRQIDVESFQRAGPLFTEVLGQRSRDFINRTDNIRLLLAHFVGGAFGDVKHRSADKYPAICARVCSHLRPDAPIDGANVSPISPACLFSLIPAQLLGSADIVVHGFLDCGAMAAENAANGLLTRSACLRCFCFSSDQIRVDLSMRRRNHAGHLRQQGGLSGLDTTHRPLHLGPNAGTGSCSLLPHSTSDSGGVRLQILPGLRQARLESCRETFHLGLGVVWP
jgi:hypothetical protein